MCQLIVREHVQKLVNQGLSANLVEAAGQCYAWVQGVDAPVPPWDRRAYDLLVAVPAAYDDAGLDAFYLQLPYSFKAGTHPRVNGAVLELQGHRWQLVSWHYPENRPWQRGMDNLETHILHCKGFFLHRGAVNAY